MAYNEEYWLKRTEERVLRHWKNLKSVEKELAKEYRIALDTIQQMIGNLYIKYASDNKISYQEAQRLLNATEITDYRLQIQQLKSQARQTNDPNIIAEMEKLEKATRLSRFQALMNQILARLLLLGYVENTEISRWLADLYEENYYRTIYQVQTGVGAGASFALINDRAIQTAITYAWSGDMFSSRIWDNKQLLVKNLRQTLIQGFITGASIQKQARKIAKEMDSSYSHALRLVRTESAFVIGESTAEGYRQSKVVDQYIIIATLDGRTSPICRKQDSKVYKLSERQVGVNASPFHPNCRTTEAPYFSDEDLQNAERIARGEDGRTYKVPASMSYEEWYNKYVKGVA